MATRREIRDAVYDDLVSFGTGDFTVTFDDGSTTTLSITEDDVDLINPEGWEKVPGIYYRPQTSTRIKFNGAAAGPDHVERNSSGIVQYAQWDEYREDMFLLFIRAQTPAHREPPYESIHRGFEKYDLPVVGAQELHPDVQDIRVESSNPANSEDLEDAIWGDQLELYVRYRRKYIIESGGSMTMDEAVGAVENIAQVNLEVDADLNDTTEGFTYTIQ